MALLQAVYHNLLRDHRRACLLQLLALRGVPLDSALRLMISFIKLPGE